MLRRILFQTHQNVQVLRGFRTPTPVCSGVQFDYQGGNQVVVRGKRRLLPHSSYTRHGHSTTTETKTAKPMPWKWPKTSAVISGLVGAAAVVTGLYVSSLETSPVPSSSEVPTALQEAKSPYGKITVDFLLYLSEEIGRNMEFITEKMLADLEHELKEEQNLGKVSRPANERRADMVEKFQLTLERVQDSVYRNNYVTSDQVLAALEAVQAGTLPGGGGQDGKLSYEQAEKFEANISRIERLRWLATGERRDVEATQQPISKHSSTASMSVDDLLEILEDQARETKAIITKVVADAKAKGLTGQALDSEILNGMVGHSFQLSEALQAKYRVSPDLFQESLIVHSSNARIQSALQEFVADQAAHFDAVMKLT